MRTTSKGMEGRSPVSFYKNKQSTLILEKIALLG